ncbi:hypothetical protein GA0115240_119639 [Streptomyces sp. DvalAA-14]|nr:hypothetical protein GA0115240_119639 [Streptomyces sp. DvalAA-14]
MASAAMALGSRPSRVPPSSRAACRVRSSSPYPVAAMLLPLKCYV